MNDADIARSFGASTEVELLPLPPHLTGPERARRRALIRRSIASCTACGLRDGCSAPVPFHGPTEPVCVVLGEGPGSAEDARGKPFVGPSGKLLRALLKQAHIEPDDCLFANVVCCRPPDNRTPNEEEMRACRDHLADQMVIGGTRYVLLVGGTALKAFRSDLKVSQVHGQVFVWGERWVVMPIYHPAAILRTRSLKVPTMEDLAKWRDIVTGEMEPLVYLGDVCVRCGKGLEHYDPDGVPYCLEHWARYGSSWKKERKRWDKAATGQEGFFG